MSSADPPLPPSTSNPVARTTRSATAKLNGAAASNPRKKRGAADEDVLPQKPPKTAKNVSSLLLSAYENPSLSNPFQLERSNCSYRSFDFPYDHWLSYH